MKAFLFLAIVFSSLPAAAQSAFYKGRLVPGVWADSWSATLVEGLVTSDLLNHHEAQIDQMCSGYRDSEDKRRIFWQQLFISLGWKESLHGPGNWIEFNGGRNNGLYQINPKLRTAYGCGNADLFNAQENIACAVKMARKLVTKFGSFLTGPKGGMAAYWQPLRATNSLNRKNREFILSTVRGACASGALEYHSRDFVPADLDFVPSFNTIDDLELSEDELEPDNLNDSPVGSEDFSSYN